MLFKTKYDAPDAGSDDAPEAVAVAPLSPARQRLAKLLEQRSEAGAAMESAKASIAKLQQAQNLDAQHVQALAVLDAQESEHMRLWSEAASDTPPPSPDHTKREALTRSINEARATADAAKRAIPSMEASFTRASNKIASATGAINALIAEIIISEVASDFSAIVAAKSALAALVASAEAGRSVALALAESIQQPQRHAIADGFYNALGKLDAGLRERAASNPPMSRDSGPWASLARALQSDASATVGGEG